MKKLSLLLAGFVLTATAYVGSAEARPRRHIAPHRGHSQPYWNHTHRHSSGCGHRIVTHPRPRVRYYPAPVTVDDLPVVYYDDYDPYWAFGFNSEGAAHFEFGW